MKTQESLVDLGEAAIRSRGYGGFSYADIARDAGIRKASIHHHFPAKSDLGLAVLERYSERLQTALADIEATSRTGGDALRGAIALYRAALGDGERMCLCAALASDIVAISPEMRTSLQSANEMTARWFESILLRGRRDRTITVGGDPAEEAVAILAQLQGAQLLARAATAVEPFDKATVTLSGRIGRL